MTADKSNTAPATVIGEIHSSVVVLTMLSGGNHVFAGTHTMSPETGLMDILWLRRAADKVFCGVAF